MFCNHCGKEIIAGKKFCSYCGAAVIPPTEKKKAPVIHKEKIKDKTPAEGSFAEKPVKEKKAFRINKALIVSIFEAAAIGFVVWALFRVGKSIYGPETLAKSYMDAIAEDDWEKIMNLTDVEESEFVNKQSLKTAISESISGDFDTYEVSLKNMRGSSATVDVEYGDGGRTDNDLTLIMSKQDEKALYVFDTWKVSAESYIVEDFKVYVPKGTEAYFDGIKLSDDYKKGLSTLYEGENASFESYEIPEICIGNHQAAAMVGDYAISVKSVDVTDEGEKEVRLSDVTPSEELQEEVINAAYSYLQTILDSKVSGNQFNSIKDLFIDDQEARKNARNTYENSLDSYYEHNGENGIKKITVTSADGSMQDFYLSNEGDLSSQININFKYDTTKISQDWWSKEEKEDITKNKSGNFYAYLEYVDGSWKIKEMQLPYGL